MVTFYGRCGSALERFVEGEEEGVGHALGGEVGAGAVARNDRDGEGSGSGGLGRGGSLVARSGRGCRSGGCGGGVEGEELLEDAVHQLVVVAAGVVGAADGTREEGVTGEEDAAGALVEAQAADGVARSFDDFETEGADSDHVSLGNGLEPARKRLLVSSSDHRECLRQWKAVSSTYIRVCVFQCEHFAFMCIDRNPVFPGKCGHAVDVVEMGMGQHDADRSKLARIHK